MKWFVAIPLIIGGLGWVVMVVGAVSMASRGTTNSELAPALIGVAAIALGSTILLWG